MNNEDAEDDPIVKEIDVFLNRFEDEADFYLLQYPLRPVYRPYGDHGRLCRIRRREESKRLELTYALNTQGDQYSAEARATVESLLSLKAENKLPEQAEAELNALMYHKLLSSVAKMDEGCEYGLAYMKNGNLFITPAARLLQFRPDFSHQDSFAKFAKARAQELGAAMSTTDGTPSTGESAEAATANVDFDRGLQSRIKLTHAQQKSKEDNEPFREVDIFYDPDSPETAEITNQLSTFPIKYLVEVAEPTSDLEFLMEPSDGGETPSGSSTEKKKVEVRSKRVAPTERTPVIKLNPDPGSYLSVMCSGCSSSLLAGTRVSSSDDKSAGVGTGPLSYLALSRLSLPEQVKQVMRIRQVETLSTIKGLLTNRSVDDGDLLKLLLAPGVAFILKGVFVARSELLYPEVVSRWTVLEQNLRDLIICLFNMNQPIKRETLRQSTQAPPEIINSVINGLFVPRDGRLQLKVPPDQDFVRAYKTLCEEGAAEWDRTKTSEIFKAIKQFQAAENARKARSSSGGQAKIDALDGLRVKSCVEKMLTTQGASTEKAILERVKLSMAEIVETDIKEALTTALQTSASVAERSGILERRNSLMKLLEGLEVPDLLPVLSETADKFMELWTLKKLDANKDVFRKILMDMYKGDPEKGIAKKEFLEECIKRRSPCALTDVATRQVFREIAVLIEGYWYYKASRKVQEMC